MSDIEIKLRDFESQIAFFNGMYKLPIAPYPSAQAVVIWEAKRLKLDTVNTKEAVLLRLEGFKKTLSDEVTEVNDIITAVSEGYKDDKDGNPQPYTPIDMLVDLADWLGDIQVYCASEMAKFGLPLKEVLGIIMSSNFSKLGADGNAILDEHGKVQKGPAYWKPEPKIKALLEERIAEAVDIQTRKAEQGVIWREGES